MNQKDSFLDSKTITAIVLVGLVWMGWQTYLSKKYPQSQSQNAVKVEAAKPTEVVGSTNVETPKAQAVEKMPAAGMPVTKEEFEKIETKSLFGELSSKGFGITNVTLKKFTDREKKPVKFETTEKKSLFALSVNSSEEPVEFKISKLDSGILKGEGRVGATTIERFMEFDETGYAIKNKIVFKGTEANIKTFSISVPMKKSKSVESSMLSPSYEHQEVFVQRIDNAEKERINVDSLKEPIKKDFPNALILSIGSQYFSAAAVNKSEISPQVIVSAASDRDIDAKLLYAPQDIKDGATFEFITYLGPKNHDTLKGVDEHLATVIDFGFFSGIGKVLLVVLKWFNQFAGNWGISIILLTLAVRLLVLPFNIASFRSMKKMQTVQPMIQSLRERHKEDPTSLNREMMTLMKEHKVNPLGGCLPMLLQMPVFFALFQVLGHSVELYQAPFFGWIHDLSLKDPFYILPVLMGVSFWYQQKSTPTTMDPAQAKVMQFMPIVFSLMMVSLPSGLTLYTLVSTVFGIAQQKYFMMNKKPEALKA